MFGPKKSSPFQQTLDNFIRFTSSIGEQTDFSGSFNGGENIVVRGTVRGDSHVQGIVVITDTGRWIGSLSADVVIIAGKFHGDVTAREKIEVQSTAQVQGNLHSPSLAIEYGAVHVGHVLMAEVESAAPVKPDRTETAQVQSIKLAHP